MPEDIYPKAENLDELNGQRPAEVKVWPHVYLGIDTRESSPKLMTAVKKGLECMRVPCTSLGVSSSACFTSIVVNNPIENVKYHDRIQIKDKFWMDLKFQIMRPGYFTPERQAEFTEEEWDTLISMVAAQKKQGNLKQLMVLNFDKN